ncbi:hypothetical protein B0T20DRAFT_159400 [Sordaria brevicollis]|uniref:Uncharacterized protein n=1 Tax=Sordaria brevicollis TaxID=83679 RepID=A0AAE0PK63_SORBR|nr:hypothetical protein B0T20DRAFT_159400 [Sordaria brevicollis]
MSKLSVLTLGFVTTWGLMFFRLRKRHLTGYGSWIAMTSLAENLRPTWWESVFGVNCGVIPAGRFNDSDCVLLVCLSSLRAHWSRVNTKGIGAKRPVVGASTFAIQEHRMNGRSRDTFCNSWSPR